MTAQVPLGSDFVINFTNFRSGSSDIDLSSVDNYICVISSSDPGNAYVVKKDYSITPSAFTIDTTNRIVSIKISAGDLTEQATHYVNLYLYIGTEIITNLSKCFDTKTSVQP